MLNTPNDCLKFRLYFLLLDLLSSFSTALTPSNVAEGENGDDDMAKALASGQICFLLGLALSSACVTRSFGTH